jgi:hypothetical protein
VVTIAQTSERQKHKKRPTNGELNGDGLSALDRERAASLADEGGSSAATVELQKDDESAPPTHQPVRGGEPGGTRH